MSATTVSALARSTHPGPAIAVTVVATALGTGLGIGPFHVFILFLSFLFNQASVGLSNDWIDADRDRQVGRTDKPVALGLVSKATVRTAAFSTAVLAIILTLPLGIRATVAQAIFIVSAWSYNLWLKNTALSVVPYIVSFGLLPLIVTLSLPTPSGAAPWALGLGALLGIAAHFANVLPDLDDDEKTGIAGLPHRLGLHTSAIVICVVLVLSALLAFFGPAGAQTPAQWIGLALTLVLCGAVAARLRRPPTRQLFQLIISAAFVIVAMLILSGSHLVS